MLTIVYQPISIKTVELLSVNNGYLSEYQNTIIRIQSTISFYQKLDLEHVCIIM